MAPAPSKFTFTNFIGGKDLKRSAKSKTARKFAHCRLQEADTEGTGIVVQPTSSPYAEAAQEHLDEEKVHKRKSQEAHELAVAYQEAINRYRAYYNNPQRQVMPTVDELFEFDFPLSLTAGLI